MSDSVQTGLPRFDERSQEEMPRIVEALHRAHRLVSIVTDLDALLRELVQESRQVARAEASSLLLYEPAREELYFHVALGEKGDQEALKRSIRLKLGQGIAGIAAQSRESILVTDALTDPRVYRDADSAAKFETRNLLAVPMVDRDNLIGVLEVVNREDGGDFSTLDLHALEMFAGLAATAVVNARLINETIQHERLAAIGLAMTHLSHYTKNIVTGLSSSTDLIEMGLQCDNIDVLKRCFPVFKRSVRRISNFVQDMLSYSKARTPVREVVTVDAIVAEAAETFTELFLQKHVDLRIETAEVTRPLYIEPQAMYRCLLNLLGNAAYALPGSNGVIRVHAHTLEDGGVIIDVIDNGPGVPEHFRDKIFDPFFSTKGAEGTGLGLAVAKKMIEEHGGTLDCLAAPGGGAQFRIQLPAAAPAESDALGNPVPR